MRDHRNKFHLYAGRVTNRAEYGGWRRNKRGLAHTFRAVGPEGFGVFDQDNIDRRHVADGGDQIIVQIVGLARNVFFHQRHAQPLRDAAVNLPFDLLGIDRLANIVGGDDTQHFRDAQFHIDFDQRDLRAEAVGRVGDALAVFVEFRGRRIVAAVAVEIGCEIRK